jgi:hypothetical protein
VELPKVGLTAVEFTNTYVFTVSSHKLGVEFIRLSKLVGRDNVIVADPSPLITVPPAKDRFLLVSVALDNA